MRPRAAVLESLHSAALGLWLGVIVVSGATAAVIFPTMHGLEPRLRDYSGYTGPHWSLAAGTVANRVFNIAGVVELACAAVALGTLGVLCFTRALPRWSAVLRPLIAGGIAVALVLRAIPTARIAAELVAYDVAARAGDNAAAEQHRQVIASLHPSATTFLSITAIMVVLALAASLLSTARPRTPEIR